MREVIVAERLVTCDPDRASPGNPLGVLTPGACVIDGGRLSFVGDPSALAEPGALLPRVPLVTPGLVDAHTHAAWMGSRHDEYAVRMAGGDYEAIARAGGGIVSTARAIAEATEEAIGVALGSRLRTMASLGVTTTEVKSGYGLEAEGEWKQLRAIARTAERKDLPRVVPTFLALHALPSARKADGRRAYAESVRKELLPAIAEAGLARFVDAYVDESAFSVEDARRCLEDACALGLGVRLHVGQFKDVGGAELAADLRAASADHLEAVSESGIAALARSGVAAGLLPIAAFTLKQSPPPIEALRAAGVALVVASDANPGTAPSLSLPLAIALAVRSYGLTPEEALLGATRVAARSLGLTGGEGTLVAGGVADLVVWDAPHERALVQPWGAPLASRVLREGVPLTEVF